MTWREFKSQVDEYLKANDEPDTIKIFYIDTGNYPDSIDIAIDEVGPEENTTRVLSIDG